MREFCTKAAINTILKIAALYFYGLLDEILAEGRIG